MRWEGDGHGAGLGGHGLGDATRVWAGVLPSVAVSVLPDLLPALDPPFPLAEALLVAGQRRVVQLLVPSAARLAACTQAGWKVATLDKGDSAFVGHQADVERARVLHEIVSRATELTLRAATAELQRLLGYPACCIRAFVSSEDFADDAMLSQVAQVSPSHGLPMVNNIFVMEHRLILHWPCRFDCEASATQGRAALGLVDVAEPARIEPLTALLMAPLVAWDRLRFVMSHPEAGDITAERITRAPVVVDSEVFRTFCAALPDRPEGGHSLHFEA